MLDELLDERRQDFLHESQQKGIITRYCSSLEARLMKAASRDEARALLDASCRDFEQSCPSRIVRNVLVSYAESLFKRHWSLSP